MLQLRTYSFLSSKRYVRPRWCLIHGVLVPRVIWYIGARKNMLLAICLQVCLRLQNYYLKFLVTRGLYRTMRFGGNVVACLDIFNGREYPIT
ncbi:hypothetical protein K445DRAFT_288980 [Daldinia sp. EC12]|nr:hypothetical protein K445DRAFT_288980 [Daldinia sp. EC12]